MYDGIMGLRRFNFQLTNIDVNVVYYSLLKQTEVTLTSYISNDEIS